MQNSRFLKLTFSRIFAAHIHCAAALRTARRVCVRCVCGVVFLSALNQISAAEKITKNELNLINDFAPKYLDSIESENENYEIAEIFNFIWENREIQIAPLLERLKIEFVAFKGD